MTSQNSESSKKTSSISTANNNNRVVAQSVLMKEKDRNQLNNNSILSLNSTSISPNCKFNFKSRSIPPLLRIKSNEQQKSSFLADESLFDSDIEIIDEYEDRQKIRKQKNANGETLPVRKIRGSGAKKETPLLQIFDGNVVISQELSIEEVQNLLSQINSKLQSQSSVNSADFPNITFSKEENSDIEIILDDANGVESGGSDRIVLNKFPKVLTGNAKSEEWIEQPGSRGKVLLKSLSVGNKVAEILDQPSTSSETNLLISFKAFSDQTQDKSNLEHDYSSHKPPGDACAKEDEPMVEHVVMENAETELMQIELIEPVNANSSGTTPAVTASGAIDKAKLDGYSSRHYGFGHQSHTMNYQHQRVLHHSAVLNHHPFQSVTPLNGNGEPIKLPDNLESVPKAEHFPTQRHRWNTNEEIAAILISFDRHNEWQSKEVKIRPKSGSMLLYSRKKVRYRRDGYCWKKRKDGKTTREDHMKLKVQGTECIYGCYVHSAILPTFHRRCYWLLQNPDIVLVHYLNVPYPDDNKLAVIAPSLALWGDKKEWTKEELVSQLKPMCESATTSYHVYSEDEPDLNNELEISTAETVEAIVTQLMEKQRAARAATLTKQLECGCPDSTCTDGKTCAHPMRRITAANIKQEPNSRLGQLDNNNQVSSTTGSGMVLTNANTNGSHSTTIHHRVNRNERYQSGQTHQSPLVLSLSQIQTGGGLSLSQIQGGTGLLILNSTAGNTHSSNHSSSSVAMVTSFKCNPTANAAAAAHQPPLKQYHHPRNKVILKQESMETNQSSCCQQEITSSNNSQHKIDDSKGTLPSIAVASVTPFENNIFGRDKADLGKSLSSAPVTPTKCMDTSENSGSNILMPNTSDPTRSGTAAVSGSNFYNETLDLSQEDIQRTLSANMPIAELAPQRRSSQHKSPSPATSVITPDVMVSEMNPMELMDSPATAVDDDVFVNLDAFDMLGDFPELEILDHSGNNSVHEGQSSQGEAGKDVKDESSLSASNLRVDFREGSASITDYSPEWAYPEGGVKVLVTGPWYSSSSRYTVLFDSFPVPTSLVQSGVLRCFCPAHEVGLATVQVACEGFVISNTVMFEYKRPPTDDSIKLKEPKLEENENLLKFTLLQRLEAVDGKLQIKQEPGGSDMSDCAGLYHQGINFEERMVNYCQDMTSRTWSEEENVRDWSAGQRGMTLLHLAASLGYARLVCALLHWRAENSSILLEGEVDALSQDAEGFTPLMWACSRGHREAALVLYRWNHTALNIKNSSKQTALDHARAQGHTDLADEIEKLESTREETNVMLLATASNNLDRSSQSDVTPSVSPSCSVISLNSSKSHDGVFLRPDPVARSEYNKFKTLPIGLNIPERSATPSPTLGLESSRNHSEPQRLIKRSSVDSGIHLGSSQSDSLPSLRSSRYKYNGGRETPKLSRFDRSMSLPSPVMCDSYETDSRRMDFALCEVAAAGPESNSPVIDMENLSEDDTEVNSSQAGEEEVRVLTLAEQIIAAIPDRIKNESEEMQLDSSPPGDSSLASDALSDSLIEPLLDEPSSSFQPTEFNFEFSDHNYRYYDVGTPSSSLSPASSSCLHSPSPGFPLDSSSPPPTTQDFCEFFHASGSIFEKDFSNLTLSDREQRELYEAAKIIQKAYRSYKGRKKLEEDKERAAAILIQNYYRRYKQYAYFKQMTRAAMVIQNGYRSYCEHKRFKKSQEAAVCIQNYYRNYKEQGESKRTSREGTPSTGLKRTYSQRRQHQAACKIQQFMRQSKNKENELWQPKERSRMSGRAPRLSGQSRNLQTIQVQIIRPDGYQGKPLQKNSGAIYHC